MSAELSERQNVCGFEQAADGSRIWLPDLVERIASFLHPNDVACNLRLVNKATAAQFRRNFATVRLSGPVPANAFAWRWGTPGAMRSLTLTKRRELLCLTAGSGSIPNLEVALAHAGLVLTNKDWPAMCAAAAAGHLSTFELLHSQQGFIPNGWTTREAAGAAATAAAQAGQRAVCEVLLSRGAVCDTDTFCAAARGGHADLLDWLLQRRWPEGQFGHMMATYDRWTLLNAVATGCSLQVLRNLYRRCFGEKVAQQPEQERLLVSTIEAAAASPTPDWRAKVEWLESLARTPPLRSSFCCPAAASCPDALARLTWLRHRGYAVSTLEAKEAARAGNVAALEYLLDEGVELRPPLERPAAEAGQLEALKALHARGYPMDPGCVAFAACQGGHLPVVVWAVETLGAEARGHRLLLGAAASGNVELMAWLRQHGASWSASAFDYITNSGCEEAVEWAVSQGCPMQADGEPYVWAARNGDLATLRCLRRLGCPWGPAGRVFTSCVCRAPQPWPPQPVRLPILQWLVQEGCVVDWQAALAAARSVVSPSVWAWLEEQRLEQLGPAQEEGPVVPFRAQ